MVLIFFFFKQKTAYELRISDWSSDVCSSDLGVSTFHTSHDTPPVSGSSATSPSPTSPAARNPSTMSASAVMSQLLPDPGADEVGGGLALFDRVLEIMRAGDEFERLDRKSTRLHSSH